MSLTMLHKAVETSVDRRTGRTFKSKSVQDEKRSEKKRNTRALTGGEAKNFAFIHINRKKHFFYCKSPFI